MKKILGISAFYHDSAAAICFDNELIAAAQEERFTREKQCADFPIEAIKYCLKEANISLDELDAVVFYDKPFLKFERLLETYLAFAPKGVLSFIKSMPVWLNEKLFLKKKLYDGLKEIQAFSKKDLKLLFTEHHLSHAASAYYPSPFEESAILTIDGVGEWTTASISQGKNGEIRLLKEMKFPHSVGLLYSAFTYYLGFKVNSGEYKVMGLAPYGEIESTETTRFIELIKNNVVDIKSDGSIWLNQNYFNYSTGLRMIHEKKWFKLFGVKRREEESELEQVHCNLALALQIVTEEIVLKMAKEAKRITQSDNICLAGGVALNCVANGKLIKENLFKQVYIQAASGDAGGAVGAALAASNMYFETERKVQYPDGMKGTYLGPAYLNEDIEEVNKKYEANFTAYEEQAELLKEVAQLLDKGNVIGWFQGRMEFGPRALGNRSILADPRNEEMQRKLNIKIKQREGFRPFAPAVLKEDQELYFDLASDSNYMQVVAPIHQNQRIPTESKGKTLWDKLYSKRSQIQAVTHLDYSARLQTVDKNINPLFHDLLTAFKSQTQCSVLINTSFNVRGEPIVNTPFDAYHCFMNTEMDYLVMNNYVYCKTQQTDWDKKEKWKKSYALD